LGQLLKIACWDYDRVNALRDGRAKIEGCDIAFTVNAPHNFFFRAGESPPYDVMEQSFSSYLTRRSRGPVPYTAIPIYPSRIFRHSAIYIRTDRGIRAPADLKGRRIGVPFYGITAVTTARGILADEYGVKPEDLIWVNGGLFDPKERLTQDLGLPASIRIEQETEKSLSQLLIEGGIDGLITAASPSRETMKAPNVGRLFPDYRAVEQAYYKKTRIFPIMHVLGIKTEVLARDPCWRCASTRASATPKTSPSAISTATAARSKRPCPGSCPISTIHAPQWARISGPTGSRRTGRRSKR
jgi:4,5-dihydroxyphthalate decarboxylase